MTPDTKIVEQKTAEQHLDEQFIRQVEDHSLPAQEVLTDQQQGRSSTGESKAPALFVP
ncbi:MAG: hypothetical protein ACM3MF_08285 [Anaerolineae bacterium]